MTFENKEEVKEYIREKKKYFHTKLDKLNLLTKMSYFIASSYPASINHHHSYDCGLVKHTYEVMKICESIADTMGFTEEQKDNLLFLALIHDLGKMNEYTYDVEGGWTKTDFGSHIEYGYYKLVDYNNLQAKRLAAHHGRKEWGALFEPFDKISWALHLADMISAKCE